MPLMKSPAFQFYPSDWLSSRAVRLMDAEQRGWYIQLLAEAWQSRPQATLPNDDQLLMRLAEANQESLNFEARWNFVIGQFARKGDLLINARLANEKKKQEATREKRRVSGSQGAKSKWGENGNDPKYSRPRSERLAAAREKGRHTQAEWQEMLDYFDCECLKCGAQSGIVKDHIIPIYQGGSDSITNIQPLCRKCNSGKGANNTDLRVGRVPDERLANVWQVPSNGKPERLATPGSSSSFSSSSSINASPEEMKPNDDGLFRSLANVCRIDWHVCTAEQRGALNQTVGILRKAGRTAAEIEQVGEWWFTRDWRGKQGQAPRPEQVREVWQQAFNPMPPVDEHPNAYRKGKMIL